MHAARWTTWAAVTFAVCRLVSAQATQPAPALPERVDKAVARGFQYLLTHAKAASAEEKTLALLAIRSSHATMDDPRASGDGYTTLRADVLKTEPTTLRELALRKGNLFTPLEPRRDMEKRIEAFLTERNRYNTTGGYAASAKDAADVWSTAWASMLDVELHEKVATFVRKQAIKSGGWTSVTSGDTPEFGTTAAAILTLIRVNENLPAPVSPNPELTAGLKVLAEQFSPDSRDYGSLWLTGRVMRGLGMPELGVKDWFEETASRIVAAQNADGSWPGDAIPEHFGKKSSVTATAYALLFLNESRRSVALNFLSFGEQKPEQPDVHGDMRRLTQWISRQACWDDLNWQAVTSKTSLTTWARSRIVVVSARGDERLSTEDVAALKEFVKAGGMVVSTCEESNKAFTEAVMDKYAPQCVENGRGMELLGEVHPLLGGGGSAMSSAITKTKAYGLSNGIRVVWMHVPQDLPASWRQRRTVQQAEHFSLMLNAFAYADHSVGRDRLVSLIPPVPASSREPGQSLALSRLDYGPGADPEPGAFRRFAALFESQTGVSLKVTLIKPADLDVKQTPVAHLTGVDRFALNADDTKKIREFVLGGGTLIADAAGGSEAFAKSFADVVRDAFNDAKLETIPINEAMYAGKLPNATRIETVEYRRYARLKGKRNNATPTLKGLRINGRWAVIFSEDDITSGLLGTNTWGIMGFTPESSEQLMRNLILYSRQNAAATQAK